MRPVRPPPPTRRYVLVGALVVGASCVVALVASGEVLSAALGALALGALALAWRESTHARRAEARAARGLGDASPPSPAADIDESDAVSATDASVAIGGERERELRAAPEWLSLAPDAVGVGLFEWDLSTGRVRWDTQLESLCGLAPGQFEGTPAAFEALRHPEDARGSLASLLTQAAAAGRSEELRIARADGSSIWLLVRSKIARGTAVEPEQIIGACLEITDRKRMEEELRESRQRMRLKAEAARIGTFETDFGARRVRFSTQACELLGMPDGTELAMGESFGFAPPEARARLRATFAAACDPTGDGRFEDETTILRGGEPRTLSYRGRVEFRETPGGRVPWRALGALLDVTDRRRAELALRESEQRWRLAFETNAIGSFAVDVEGRRFDASPELREMLGLPSAGTLDVADAIAMVKAEDLAELRARFATAAAPGSDGRVRVDVRVLPGERWVAFNAQAEFRDTPNGRVPVRVFGVALDIEQRKRFEASLRDGERLFRALVDNSAVIVWLKDADGRYVYVSANYERRFGLGRGECLGKTDLEIWPHEVADELRRNDQQVVASGAALEVVEGVVTAAGERSWWHSAKLPFEASTGERFVGGLAVDITAERVAQERIREAEKRKDEFIAILAHELRNPLAPLRNAAKLLGDGGVDLAYCQDLIARQVGHMSQLLDDLADVSRITLGKLTLHRQRVDLARAVLAAVEMIEPLAEANGHSLRLDLPDAPMWVDADLSRMVRVIANLLGNAIRYSDPGRPISVHLATDGARVTVSVEDEGIGISPEDLPHVFELFASAHSARSNATGGMGIGLALSRALVELHGGTITGHSEGPGKGSRFEISLDAAGPPARARQASQPVPERVENGAKHRVLVADDLADGADSMALLLRAKGYEVVTAYGGAEALAAAERFRPHVAILDIGMPELDGYQVSRRIRAEPWGRRMVLIALTGWRLSEDQQHAQEAGFDHHLTKPVDPQVLQQLIASSLSEDHQGDPS